MNPYSTPTTVDPAALAAWTADNRAAADAYAEQIAHPRCGRCSWPETATHECKGG